MFNCNNFRSSIFSKFFLIIVSNTVHFLIIIFYFQANPTIKPQFEPRINISTAQVPQQAPSYGYNPKSNLISLGVSTKYK